METNLVKIEKKKLADLYKLDPVQIENEDQLNLILNQPPNEKWIKKHPYIKDHLYIPIQIVEVLLAMIYKKYKIEIRNTKSVFNAVEVNVRVHYRDIDGEWMFHDGTGSQELQTKKDTGILKPDFSNVNPGAVAMAIPIAKSLAIKDACDHLGKLFGRDLNRKDYIEYQTTPKSISQVNDLKEIARIKEQIQKCDNGIDLAKLWDLSDKYGLSENYNNQLKKISDGM